MDKGTVLLIDDDLDMLLIGQRIFGRAGFTFISARTGKEGLEKIKSECPDLILLDFILPDIGGRQLLETLAIDREYSEFRDIPVIVLTARADFIDDLDQFFEYGLKAYLQKPFGHRELVNIVENFIRISQLERARISKPLPEQSTAEPIKQETPPTLEKPLAEEVKLSATTIMSLCKMFLDTEGQYLSEGQRMSLKAIYSSSRNLVKFLE